MLVCLHGVAPARAASSGSIAITGVSGNQLTFTANVAFDCAGNSYCGWFATVRQTTPSAPCSPADSPWWVGPVTEQPTASYTQTQQPYGWYSGQQPPVRMCLYLYDGADQL